MFLHQAAKLPDAQRAAIAGLLWELASRVHAPPNEVISVTLRLARLFEAPRCRGERGLARAEPAEGACSRGSLHNRADQGEQRGGREPVEGVIDDGASRRVGGAQAPSRRILVFEQGPRGLAGQTIRDPSWREVESVGPTAK